MVNYTGETKRGQTIAARPQSEEEAHYERVRAEDEYAVAQECLIRDHNERAIERTNDEAYETSPHEEVDSASRDHKTATACGAEPQSSGLRAFTRNDPDCLRQDQRSGDVGHHTESATARTGTGSGGPAVEEKETVPRKVRRIDTGAPLKRRRNIIAGVLAFVDAEHAHDAPANLWLEYVQAQLPSQMFLPCVHCVKGGSRTLLVNIRADLSVSIECKNKACEANYKLEYGAPDHEKQTSLAEEGADWLASYQEHAKKTQKPWLYVWIEKAKGLIDGPASKTLKTLLRIYELARTIPQRWSVAESREFLDEHGLTVHGDAPCRHDGDAVPVLLRPDLAYIAKKEHLSEKQVAKYLRMLVRIRLLRVAVRLEHGQIVYQAGWWLHTSGMPHSRPMWFLKNQRGSKKWQRRLRHVSSGQIRLQ